MGSSQSRSAEGGSEEIRLHDATDPFSASSQTDYGLTEKADEVEDKLSADIKKLDNATNTDNLNDHSQATKRRCWGIIAMTTAAVFSACASASSQYLLGAVPSAELNALRFAMVTVLLAPRMVHTRCDIKVDKHLIKWTFLVGILYGVIVYMLYTAVVYLPTGTVAAIDTGCGVLLYFLISCLLFKEIGVNMVVACVMAIIGITLVAQPPFLFSGQQVSAGETQLQRSPCFLYCSNRSIIVSCEGSAERSDDQNGTYFEKRSNTSFGGNSTGDIPLAGWHSNTTMSYIFIICALVLTSAKDFIIHLKIPEVTVVVYGIWVPVAAIGVSLLTMIITETPTWPTCWACSLTVFFHTTAAAAGRVFYFLGMQRVRPLEAIVIYASVNMLLMSVLQYTALSSIHPGHRNWEEYLGLGFMFFAMIVGPGRQAWPISREDPGH